MYCESCGGEISESADYCSSCGTPVESQVTDTGNSTQTGTKQDRPSDDTDKNIFISFPKVGILIGSVLVIASYYFLTWVKYELGGATIASVSGQELTIIQVAIPFLAVACIISILSSWERSGNLIFFLGIISTLLMWFTYDYYSQDGESTVEAGSYAGQAWMFEPATGLYMALLGSVIIVLSAAVTIAREN